MVVDIPDPDNPTVVVERADGSGDRRTIHWTECRRCPSSIVVPIHEECTEPNQESIQNEVPSISIQDTY